MEIAVFQVLALEGERTVLSVRIVPAALGDQAAAGAGCKHCQPAEVPLGVRRSTGTDCDCLCSVFFLNLPSPY